MIIRGRGKIMSFFLVYSANIASNIFQKELQDLSALIKTKFLNALMILEVI